MDTLVNDSWQQISCFLQAPYVLFGHSLGSTLAYLLAHKAIEESSQSPLHLFLSGADGPSVPPDLPYKHLYSKTEFKEQLKTYGGISEEILNDADAYDFFEPIIRADLQAIDTWQYSEKPPLAIPATVITGTEEDMTEAEIQLWQKEFSTEVTFKKMQGNHFFLFDHAQQFVELLEEDLLQTLSKNTKQVVDS